VLQAFEGASPVVRQRMLSQLVVVAFQSASPAGRRHLLERLVRPLGLLSLAAVAGGIFAKIRLRSHWQDVQVQFDDVQNVRASDLGALVDHVQQVSVEAVAGVAQVIAAFTLDDRLGRCRGAGHGADAPGFHAPLRQSRRLSRSCVTVARSERLPHAQQKTRMPGWRAGCQVEMNSHPMVPGVGIEPTPLSGPDFESGASTNFTTRAAAGRVERNYGTVWPMNYSSIEDLIGKTPLVRLQRIGAADEPCQQQGNVILGKLEGNNPAGSVKDRAGVFDDCKARRRAR
jgi:hypothetical protein